MIEQYQIEQINSHIRSFSYVFKPYGNGFTQIFCPYCDDATRRSGRLSHGHMYFNLKTNYCHCFRCDHHGSLSNLLVEIQFNDFNIINQLKKISGNFKGQSFKERQVLNFNIFHKVINSHIQFQQEYPTAYIDFLNYIQYRCLDINPIDYLIEPSMNNNKICCAFYNYNNVNVNTRFIANGSVKFLKKEITDIYFFQNIHKIYRYINLVVCEGNFDLINLAEYSRFAKSNTFFIAINGKSFHNQITKLISQYLLIGNYTINVIFDKDMDLFYKKTIKQLIKTCSVLNPQLNLIYYKPSLTKDVSELMLFEKINA